MTAPGRNRTSRSAMAWATRCGPTSRRPPTPRTGREVVQAYLEPPTVDPGRPVRVLAAFAAVTAAPGEYAEARLTLPARSFARYDEATGTWVRPSGEFTIRIGRSSADLPLHLRVKSF